MPFAKGRSGNPLGRPPKSRALSAILEGHINDPIEDGSDITNGQQVGKMLWQFARTGKVTFPDGTELKAENAIDWINAVRWLYGHIDGPAQGEQDKQIEILITRGEQPKLIYDGD